MTIHMYIIYILYTHLYAMSNRHDDPGEYFEVEGLFSPSIADSGSMTVGGLLGCIFVLICFDHCLITLLRGDLRWPCVRPPIELSKLEPEFARYAVAAAIPNLMSLFWNCLVCCCLRPLCKEQHIFLSFFLQAGFRKTMKLSPKKGRRL